MKKSTSTAALDRLGGSSSNVDETTNNKRRQYYLKRLSSIPLRRLDCSFGTVSRSRKTTSLETVVQSQATKQTSDMTLLVAMTGPLLEDGENEWSQLQNQLTRLARQENVALVGVVTAGAGVTDKELAQLATSNTFRFPLYQDESSSRTKVWGKILGGGNKKAKFETARKLLFSSSKHESPEQQQNDSTAIGILLFDCDGRLRYCTNQNKDERVLRQAILHTRLHMFDEETTAYDDEDDEESFLSEDTRVTAPW